MCSIIKSNFSLSTLPVVLVTSDGGPDHCLTYLSVKVALIALFVHLDVDMLIAISTCPYQSWTNMAERVMSTPNLALQNVSLAREEMADLITSSFNFFTFFTTPPGHSCVGKIRNTEN